MSNAKYIQESYTAITPYLNSKLDLIDFLKNAFGAEVRRPTAREIFTPRRKTSTTLGGFATNKGSK
jgi:hypothetical protein